MLFHYPFGSLILSSLNVPHGSCWADRGGRCAIINTDIVAYNVMEKDEVSRFGEWTLEELDAERERLLSVLDDVEQALLDRLGFADAIPVRYLRRGGQLIGNFERDPRPVVVFITGTDLSCILKPADPNNLPTTSIPAGRLVSKASSVAHQASGGERVGVRHRRAQTERIVAEFCPPTRLSRLFLRVRQGRRN